MRIDNTTGVSNEKILISILEGCSPTYNPVKEVWARLIGEGRFQVTVYYVGSRETVDFTDWLVNYEEM